MCNVNKFSGKLIPLFLGAENGHLDTVRELVDSKVNALYKECPI